ncbi:MAG: beta-lactamase family protein [Chloroflexota bacterium]|nr:beta-lactamase family protein [Chloroflexota bacterium]
MKEAGTLDSKELDTSITQMMADWPVPGLAVAIVQDDAVIFARGYGTHRLGESLPVDEDTIFPVASVTKAFTATSLAMLVDDGRLSLDDRVVQHLPHIQLYDPWVTCEMRVRDLLCHRSGLATFGGDLLWYGTRYSRDEVLHRIRYLPPASSFRSEFGYQNVMYLAAGMIVAAITGEEWDAFVHDRIFGPLGMRRSTTSISALAGEDNLVSAHTTRSDPPQRVAHLNMDNCAPAGAINSTARDLAQWLRLQLGRGTYEGRQLFSSALAREMWNAHTPLVVTEEIERLAPSTHFVAYGLGWGMRDYHGRKLLEHTGGLPGISTYVGFMPEANVGLVALTNSDTALPLAAARSIFD